MNTILEIVKENALAHPERMAIVESNCDSEIKLTWQELDVFSDKLAAYLDEVLVSKKPLVVYGHKNPYMIVCFLACVKTGRAYCPVDVSVPLIRVNAIIEEVNPELILCTEELDINNEKIKKLTEIKDIIDKTENIISSDKYVAKEDVFYIIFTSGSTGTPKGVQITRDCVDNFVRWIADVSKCGDSKEHFVFLNQAPFSFDLSVMDLFLCLYTGGTLWCLSKNVQLDSRSLYESMKKSNANIWVSTPSFADVCLTDPLFSEELMPNLKAFLFCGEVLTNKTVERLQKRFHNVDVINTYGPTESTCAVTSICVTPEINESFSPLPVGVAKPGTWIKIVDENGQEVSNGEHGEIVIIGDSVSIGYWNNIEKNKKSFGMTVLDNVQYRYYKTGDEGYFENEQLFYCGRIDLQVKLHGYRIELEDIENNLLRIEFIHQAVVVPKYRNGKVSSLAAAIVVNSEKSIEDISSMQIKNKLKETLPEYMIPKKIKVISDLPRTSNGKIDRKAVGTMV